MEPLGVARRQPRLRVTRERVERTRHRLARSEAALLLTIRPLLRVHHLVRARRFGRTLALSYEREVHELKQPQPALLQEAVAAPQPTVVGRLGQPSQERFTCRLVLQQCAAREALGARKE